MLHNVPTLKYVLECVVPPKNALPPNLNNMKFICIVAAHFSKVAVQHVETRRAARECEFASQITCALLDMTT